MLKSFSDKVELMVFDMGGEYIVSPFLISSTTPLRLTKNLYSFHIFLNLFKMVAHKNTASVVSVLVKALGN